MISIVAADYAEIQEESENALTVEQMETILQGFVNENLVYYLIQQMSGELAKCKILK